MIPIGISCGRAGYWTHRRRRLPQKAKSDNLEVAVGPASGYEQLGCKTAECGTGKAEHKTPGMVQVYD